MPANLLRDDPSATVRPVLDPLRGLMVASRLWSRRVPIASAAIRAAMDEAVLALHRHYVGTIPVYRRIALECGLAEGGDAAVVAGELLLSSDVFKAYDPEWVADGDFEALTRWLATVFVREPAPAPADVPDLAAWRTALRADGVFVTLSSGTTGSPSFVPRDAMTLTALRSNGILYGALLQGEAAMPPSYDCLALTPRATRSGLEAAGAGVAAGAARAHHLDPGSDAGWDAALAFLRDSTARQRAVVIFGPPPLVDALCARALDAREDVLAPGSAVATGGGWKGPRALTPEELAARVESALGVPPARIVDSYGAAELNCVLIRCPHGRYHVPPLVRAVVLDALLVPIKPQAEAEGRLGFLDPFALSYPGFLAPGDVGRLVDGRCGCGLDGQAIAGRIERATDEPPRGCATTSDPEGRVS